MGTPMAPSGLTLTAYCHNILADAWVNFKGDGGAAWYGRKLARSGLLDAAARHSLAFRAIAESGADVVCLQEVGLLEATALWSSELARTYHITGLAENVV